jgi:signal transduction histidine kinase/GAF domain-containing protein
MARRMREYDWAKTPVGDPSSWPESLRIALSICTTSRFPIFVWWGPSLTLFYNDAYISFLGPSKHPGMLGRSARDAWPEIWETIGPMIQHVFETGEATWRENTRMFFERAVPLEEVYVTFSYTPVLEGDRVGGIFCACTETTSIIVGNRRIETLRKLGVHGAAARTVEEACHAAATVLGENPEDFPFAAVYHADREGIARLVASVGEGAGSAPQRLPLARDPMVEPVPDRLVVPIRGATYDAPAGLFVAAPSPHRPLDDAYRSFFDNVAGHIGTALAEARADEEERGRAEALAELDRVKTAFFSEVSHEFRTPLTLILGPLEEQIAASPEPNERLIIVRRNALRLLKLVNTLLDFSRIEAGRIQASYELTDLGAYTAELASVFRSAVESAGLRFDIESAPVAAPVYVDREMWEKIVLNLVSNAFKFTFEGSITVRVAPSGADRVELHVADTGCGIPEAETPQIFARFHRVRGARARTHEGTGIGLALVQELAKVHGGEVRVDTESGRGSTFTVSIPTGLAHLPEESIGATRTLASTSTGARAFAQEAELWGQAPATAAAPRDDVAAVRGAKRVLLAEDNADMRAYVVSLLRADGHDVEAVADGAAALAAARAREPDLVLTDIMMPMLGGLGLLRELRADRRLRGLPVILLSARAGEEASVEGLASGADDYLVKPFSARELRARVRTHLELAAMRAIAASEVTARVDLLARLDRAQEDERHRLARDLHDQIGQDLTAIGLLLKAAQEDTVASVVHARVSEAQAIVGRIGRDVHTLAVRLRPTALDDLGLSAALGQLAADWSSRTGIAVDLQLDSCSSARLPAAVENAIYRVVQEALTNVAKHAAAGRTSVTLAGHDGVAIVMIEDDGGGFDPSRVLTDRLGVRGMRERVALVGGTLDIDSEPGMGTTVIARVPVQRRCKDGVSRAEAGPEG